MKSSAFFAALALSLSTLSAIAGGPGDLPRRGAAPAAQEEERGGFRNGLREGLHNLKRSITHTDRSEPGENHHVRDTISDAWRSRPRLTHYLSLDRTQDGKIMVISCDPGIKRFVERKGCEALSKRAFKPQELRSCMSVAGENDFAAARINKHLDRLLDTDMGYRNFHPLETRSSYAAFLKDCEAKLGRRTPARAAPRQAAAPRPAPAPVREPEPNPDFRPIEPTPGGEAAPFDVPVAGNL